MQDKKDTKQRPGALKVRPGDVFGHLTVIERAGSDKWGSSVWKCLCDCGKEKVVRGGHLTSGKSQSCGCSRRREGAIKIGQKNRTHGMRKTRLYRVWCAVKSRCSNPHNNRFKIYGGRGITVCEEWQRFEPFRDWALANGYTDELTIDRKDHDANYCPENCRWASQKTQSNNRRNNHKITVDGETKTISEWAKRNGLSAKTIETRLQRGWPEKIAIFAPVGTRRNRK